MFDAPNTKLIDPALRWRRRISNADVVDLDCRVRVGPWHDRAATPAAFGARFGAPERRAHDRGKAQGFDAPSEVRP